MFYHLLLYSSSVTGCNHLTIPFSIDINSTNSKSTNQVGIKIIYDRDYRIGKPNWSDIINVIIYAAHNVDLARTSQKKDTVRYNTNGWYVSLLTIDTFSINKILGRDKVAEIGRIKQITPLSKEKYLIIGLIVSVLTIAIIIARRNNR